MKYYLVVFTYSPLCNFLKCTIYTTHNHQLRIYLNDAFPIVGYVNQKSVFVFSHDNISNVLLSLSDYIKEIIELDHLPLTYEFVSKTHPLSMPNQTLQIMKYNQ